MACDIYHVRVMLAFRCRRLVADDSSLWRAGAALPRCMVAVW